MSRKDNETRRMRNKRVKHMEHSSTVKCLIAALNSFTKQKNDKSLPLPQRQEAAKVVKSCELKISKRVKAIQELDEQWS